jgi:hypothetical protein
MPATMPEFRSSLEHKVALELDAHGASWGYEVPVVFADGTSPYYLPDFTIYEAPSEVRLPRWIEVKPMDFLYDLRDTLGITRRYGPRFSGIATDTATAEQVKALESETWKAKMLAEATDEPVLVVGGVGGDSRLSVTMRRYSIDFQRDHPFVNWVGHTRRQEREAQRAQWAADRDERERQAASLEAQREATRSAENERLLALIARLPRSPARYDGMCQFCHRHRLALDLRLHRQHDGSYLVLCATHTRNEA